MPKDNKVSGPKLTEKINVKFCGDVHGLQTKNSHAIIPCSIGWPNSEGDKFAKIVEEARKQFKKITFARACELQAQLHKSEYSGLENARKHYKKLGDEWEARQRNLGIITKDDKVISWGMWLESEKYQNKLKETEQQYKSDRYFLTAIHKTIATHFRNHKNDSSKNFNIFDSSKNSEEYLIEEISVLKLWAEDENAYNFIIYTSPASNAIDYAYKNFIAPNIKDRVIYQHAAVVNKPEAQSNQGKVKLSDSRLTFIQHETKQKVIGSSKEELPIITKMLVYLLEKIRIILISPNFSLEIRLTIIDKLIDILGLIEQISIPFFGGNKEESSGYSDKMMKMTDKEISLIIEMGSFLIKEAFNNIDKAGEIKPEVVQQLMSVLSKAEKMQENIEQNEELPLSFAKK